MLKCGTWYIDGYIVTSSQSARITRRLIDSNLCGNPRRNGDVCLLLVHTLLFDNSTDVLGASWEVEVAAFGHACHNSPRTSATPPHANGPHGNVINLKKM